MALIIKNRIFAYSNSIGASNFVLEATKLGYRNWSDIGDTNSTYYTIVADNGDWEVGQGIYLAANNELQRVKVYSNSQGHQNKIVFDTGLKEVFCGLPAEEFNRTLKKDLNLSDLTDFAQARANLGFGSAAVADVVQSIGTSKINVMSQDAVTTELSILSEDIQNIDIPTLYTSIDKFGAVGDGITDDTQAIEAAITSGDPIFFKKGVYLITSSINVEIFHRVNWFSDNATLLLSSPVSIDKFISLEVKEPYNHSIKGELIIDSDMSAFDGFSIFSDTSSVGVYPDEWPNLFIEDLTVQNIYRSSTEFSGGNGIHIRGCWNNVILCRPKVINCIMAQEAEILGTEGIFGISITRLNSATDSGSHHVLIEDCFLYNIKSEDNSLGADQDGIRILLSYKDSLPYSSKYSYEIRGGIIHNCRNRAIKGQAGSGNINGVKILRDSSVGGTNNLSVVPCIDEQIGSLNINNVSMMFDGIAPKYLIGGRLRGEDYIQPYWNISNVNVSLQNSASTESIFMFNRELGALNGQNINISGVDSVGDADNFIYVELSSDGTSKRSVINITNCNADLNSSIIKTTKSGKLVSRISSFTNTSSDVNLVSTTEYSDNIKIYTSGVFGIVEGVNEDPSNGDFSGATVVSSIAPYGNGKKGLIKPYSFILTDNEEKTLEIKGLGSSTACIILARVGHGTTNAQCIIFCGNSETKIFGTDSTLWSAGTTSNPDSKSYRVWIDSGNGVRLGNFSGSSRYFTLLVIGA